MELVKRLLILSLFVLVGIGCESERVDLDAPEMEVLSFDPNPIEDEICGALDPYVFLVNSGDLLTFDVIFSDDVALSQYKVDIHNNFDCHGHGGGSAPSVSVPTVDNETTDWSLLEITDLSGTSSEVLRSLQVPEDVTAGNYHFHIQVIDEVGNDSPFDNYFSLKVKNSRDTVAPQITIQEPSSRSLTLNKGQTVQFTGTVTDNYSLSEGGNGIVYLSYTSLSTGNTFATNAYVSFDKSVTTSYDFTIEFEVPSTLVAGDFIFTIGALDGVRNVASAVNFDVEIND